MKKRKVVLSVMFLTVLLVSAGFTFNTPKAVSESRGTVKYYTSVQVDAGDSLWTIADRYITPEYPDMETYIREVKMVNGLHSDRIVQGTYLSVPYYSFERK